MRAALGIRRLILPALALLVVLLVAGCGEREPAADAAPPADLVFTIEQGALAQHMRGELTELIPAEIELVAGQSIVIRNEDQALHYFLGEAIWPGETLTKTYDEAGTFRYSGAFTCSIGASTALTVYVAESTAESTS